MKTKILRLGFVAVAASALSFFANTASAQDQGDRAQRRQEMLTRYLDDLNVKSEEDRKKIGELIGKVTDAQRESRMGGGFGFGGPRRGGAGGGGGGGGGGGNRFGGEPSAEYTALKKAIDDKAPADDIKAKLTTYREARKTKEAALEKAQGDLRKALNPRQEAAAVLAGLLK
jgi:hypothetical protein